MPLQQMAEVQYAALVRGRGAVPVNTSETAQHSRFVQRVLGVRIRKVEPMLQKVDAKHNRQANRCPPRTSLGIVRRDQGYQLGPGNDGFHGVEKLLPAAGP